MKGLFQCPRGTEGVVKTIEEGLVRGGAFLKGKEGRVGFRKIIIKEITL